MENRFFMSMKSFLMRRFFLEFVVLMDRINEKENTDDVDGHRLFWRYYSIYYPALMRWFVNP